MIDSLQELQDYDRKRDAWTNEDGNWAYQSYSNDDQYDVDLDTPHAKVNLSPNILYAHLNHLFRIDLGWFGRQEIDEI